MSRKRENYFTFVCSVTRFLRILEISMRKRMENSRKHIVLTENFRLVKARELYLRARAELEPTQFLKIRARAEPEPAKNRRARA